MNKDSEFYPIYFNRQVTRPIYKLLSKKVSDRYALLYGKSGTGKSSAFVTYSLFSSMVAKYIV